MNKIRLGIMLIVGFCFFRKFSVYLSFHSKVSGTKYINIGKKFGAGTGFWIEAIDGYGVNNFTPTIDVGDNVSFSNYCHVSSINKISIGNGVLIGSRVHITDLSHGFYSNSSNCSHPFESPINRALYSSGPVCIGDNVWIGDGVVILPGVTIGEGSIIGANSVVSRSLPKNCVAVGSPAKAIKVYEDGSWKNC